MIPFSVFILTFLPLQMHCRLSGKLRTREEGADTVIWLALQPKEKLVSGAFHFDRAEAPKHLNLQLQASLMQS